MLKSSGLSKKMFKRPVSLRYWAGILLVGEFFCCTSALAESGKVFRPYLDYSYSYDDNLFRTPDEILPQSIIGNNKLSDKFQRRMGGLIVEKEIGRQLITANLGVSRTSFDQFSLLDYDGKDLSANWRWHVGNHIEGVLGTSYIQTLTPFTEFHEQQLNLRTQKRKFVDASWLFHPSWKVSSGFSYYTLAYDLISQRAADRDRNTIELGLDFIAPSGNVLGIQLRRVQEDFPNRQQADPRVVISSYKQNEIKAKVNWRLTGKTQVNFLGGWTDRQHEVSAARDFSGINTRVIVNWAPTGKLNVSVNSWREIGAVDELTAIYSLNKGMSLTPTWDLSSKLRVGGQFKYEMRDSSGSLAAAQSSLQNRQDTFRNAAITLTYFPTMHLKLDVSIYRETLGSNMARRAYRSNGMMLSSRYEF